MPPRPMKAWNKAWSLDDIPQSLFPLIASPKLNGERILLDQGRARTSSGKLVPNAVVQQRLENQTLHGLDGEIIAGTNPTDPTLRRKTRSITGSHFNNAEFTFYVFDHWNRGNEPFSTTLDDDPIITGETSVTLPNLCAPHIRAISQHYVNSVAEIRILEARALVDGYEGLVLRNPTQPYKPGRCTWREFLRGRGMLKLKRFAKGTAVVVGWSHLSHNQNTATLGPLGQVERLGGQAGRTQSSFLLGALHVRGTSPPYTDSLFNIGNAIAGRWSHATRARLCASADTLIGKHLTYRHFPDGNIDRPNQPHFVSWTTQEGAPSC